jgi:hypothetical protein
LTIVLVDGESDDPWVQQQRHEALVVYLDPQCLDGGLRAAKALLEKREKAFVRSR